MAQPAGPIIDAVLQRVQDPGGTGTSRAVVLDLLSRLQQIVNAAFDSILVTQPFTVLPNQQVYTFAEVAPANDILRIKSVRQDKRDLSRIDFERLRYISHRWFGRTGPRLETFAVLGRQMLVIHPSRPTGDSVNIIYTQQLIPLTSEAQSVLLPDDQIPMLKNLTEALLLLKQRDFGSMQTLLKSMVEGAKAIKEGQVSVT